MAIAITMLLGQFVSMIVYGLCSQKFVGYRLKDQFEDIFVPVFLSIPMCIIVYFMPLFVVNQLVCLIIQIIIGSVLFFAMSILFKSDSLRYIANTMGIKIPFLKTGK